VVGPPLLLGLLAALIASQHTTRAWRGEARVFVVAPASRSPLLNGRFVAEPRGGLETAVSLARSPQLAGRVVRAAGVPGLTARQFLRDSSVKSARPDSGILAFSVFYRRRAFAVRLTNAYAVQFVGFYKVAPSRRAQARPHLIQWSRPRPHLIQWSRPSPFAIVIKSAHVASTFRPHALRNEVLAAMFDALLGVALAVGFCLRPQPSD
jgi:hypothetical protein